MATKLTIFGHLKVIRKNPWLSGKLASAVKMGLAKPKKELVLADLPPWFEDPSKLSDAQLYQVAKFSAVSHETAGMPISDRLKVIKKKASGPTGLAKPKAKVSMPRVGKIIRIAMERGIPVPEELQKYAEMITPTVRRTSRKEEEMVQAFAE